jgi:hypothetical protein
MEDAPRKAAKCGGAFPGLRARGVLHPGYELPSLEIPANVIQTHLPRTHFGVSKLACVTSYKSVRAMK